MIIINIHMIMCNFADEEDIPRENASVYYKCSLHWLSRPRWTYASRICQVPTKDDTIEIGIIKLILYIIPGAFACRTK